jgi:VWFA-related protein
MRVSGWELLYLLSATGLVAQPSWSPDEIKSTNRPYQPQAALRVETDLVEVSVVVRDTRGRAVAGLDRGDFTIYDEGKKREITTFSVETASGVAARAESEKIAATDAAPGTAATKSAARFITLFFDDFSITPGDLARTKLAAERLVKEALSPSDRVAIFTTSSAQRLDFTGDTAKVLEAIEKLSVHPRVNPDGILPCPRITPYQAYRIFINDPVALDAAAKEAYVCLNGPPAPTKLDESEGSLLGSSVRAQADATWQQARQASRETLSAILNAVDGLARMPGTRALVLASSGFLSDTLEPEQDRIVDHAVRAGVVIDSLDAKGLYAESPQRTSGMVRGGDVPPETFMFEQTTGEPRLKSAGAAEDQRKDTAETAFAFRSTSPYYLRFFKRRHRRMLHW